MHRPFAILALLASVAGLHAVGHTFNLMTLGGLALAIGILVDNALVEIENINRNSDIKPETTGVAEIEAGHRFTENLLVRIQKYNGNPIGMVLPAMIYVTFLPRGTDIQGLGISAALAQSSAGAPAMGAYWLTPEPSRFWNAYSRCAST